MTKFIIILMAITSCSSSTEKTNHPDVVQEKDNELIIAKVGPKNIDLQALKTFSAAIPTGMIEGNTEHEKALHLLRSLIDK